MSPPDVNPGAGPTGQPTRPLPADALIVVPVRNAVLFPEIVFPITVGRPATIAAAQQAVREQRQIVIVLLDSWGRLTRVADANRIRRWLEKHPAKVVANPLHAG